MRVITDSSKKLNKVTFCMLKKGAKTYQKNSLFSIRFVAITSDIRNFSKNTIRSDVETSEVATLPAEMQQKYLRFVQSIRFLLWGFPY